jgi:hypothetical protein
VSLDIERGAPRFNRDGDDFPGAILVPDVTDVHVAAPGEERSAPDGGILGEKGGALGGMGHGPDLLLPTAGWVAVVLLVWVLAVHLAQAATGWGTARCWHAGLCLVFRGGHVVMYMAAAEQCKAT